MGTVANAEIQYESSQTLVSFSLMADSGDHKLFTASGTVWSGRKSYEPQIRPDGIVSATSILSASTNPDIVVNASFTAWLAGALKTVSESTTTITRASVSTHVINSIILTNTTVSALKGAEGSSFTTTRGASGGPPYIPVGSIEIGQVKTSSQTPAVMLSSEIFQTPGTHQERADWPLYRSPRNYGYGVNTTITAKKNAHVDFYTAHQACHTGDLCKRIYIQYYTPTFTAIPTFNGFQPAEITSSASILKRYDAASGITSDNIKSSRFKANIENGITDDIVALDGETLIIKFLPDASKSPYMLTLGVLRFLSSLPQSGDISVECMIATLLPTARFTT